MELIRVVNENICQQCGACCAYYRVSFYGAEAELMSEIYVEDLTAIYVCMRGTNQPKPRCIALQGQIGQHVACEIYSVRSSSCKDVKMGDEHCTRARQAYRFVPISMQCTDAKEEYGYLEQLS